MGLQITHNFLRSLSLKKKEENEQTSVLGSSKWGLEKLGEKIFLVKLWLKTLSKDQLKYSGNPMSEVGLQLTMRPTHYSLWYKRTKESKILPCMQRKKTSCWM